MGIIYQKTQNINQFNLNLELLNFQTNTLTLSQVLDQQYCSEQTLTNIKKLFQLLQIQYDIEKEVDKMEFSIVIILFNKSSLETKLEQIFSLITSTGVLDFEQFFWITQAFIRATQKINLLQIPPFDQILKCAQKVYQQMRKDEDDKLMLIELIDYVKSNTEVSQFLLRYYKIQTYENAIRQQETMLQQYLEIFNKSLGLSKKYVNLEALKQNWLIDDVHQSYLIQLMVKQLGNKNKDRNFIKLSQFLFIISNYISYKINDIDNTNCLPIDFINYLVYAQEEIIISANRYDRIKCQLCKDRDFISLHMWMDYQCQLEGNKFETQLRSLVRYYQLIYQNNSFTQFIQKVRKLVKNNIKKNQTQNQYICKFLENWLHNPDLYNVGTIELKLKIEQLLNK